MKKFLMLFVFVAACAQPVQAEQKEGKATKEKPECVCGKELAELRREIGFWKAMYEVEHKAVEKMSKLIDKKLSDK